MALKLNDHYLQKFIRPQEYANIQPAITAAHEQLVARSGAGNDGAHTHVYGQDGVPTIVLSVPVRYSHTPHCYVSMDDYEKTVQLLMAILENLDAETIAGF